MTTLRPTTRQIGIRQRSLRKHCRLGRATELVFILATGVMLTLGGQAQAQDLTVSTAQVVAGTQLIAPPGDVIITGTGSVDFQSVDPDTVEVNPGGGDINNAGTITHSGSGALTITGTLTNSGTLDKTAASGTLQVNGTIDNTGTITLFNGAGVTTMTGDVSQTGSGVMNLGSEITQTGTVTNNGAGVQYNVTTGGVVTVTAGVTNTDGTVDVDSGAELIADVTNADTLDLNRGTITGNVTNTGTASLSGTVDGTYTQNTGSTSIDDGGTLAPQTTEVTGAVTINDGFLAVETDQTLEATAGITIGDGTGGAATATATINGSTVGDITVLSDGSVFANSGVAIDDDALVTLTGGELELNEDETIGGLAGNASATVDLDDKTLTVAGTGTTVFEGVISGTGGGLTKDGTGTLTLSGENTYTGATNVSAGTLAISNGLALGTVDGATTVEDGATLALSGGISTAEALTLNGMGTGMPGVGALLNVSGENTISGAITLGSATRINSDAGQLFLNGITGTNTNLTLGGAGILSTGDINLGTGTLTKDGTGGVAIAGTGTFASVTVTGGVLQINNGAAIPDAALVTLDDGTELVVVNSETVGNLAGTGTVSISDMQTLTVNTGTAGTFGGVIQGDGGLTKLGAETLTLTGANTYTGTTTISAGTLQIGAGVGGGTTGTLGSGSVTNNAALVFNRSDEITVSNQITGTGTLTKDGTGTLTLSGSNGYTGLTTISAGTLEVTGTIAGNVEVGDGTLRIASGGAIDGTITTTGSVVSYGDGIDEASALIISSATTQLEVLGTDEAQQSGIISSTGAFGFEKIGSGTLVVSGTNTYTGATVVSAGTLEVTNAAALGSTAAGTTVADGATLAFSGPLNPFSDETFTLTGTGVSDGGALRNLTGTTVLNGQITLAGDSRINADAGQINLQGGITGAGQDLTIGGDGIIILIGALDIGSGTLTKDGSGTALMANTGAGFTGDLIVEGGELQLGQNVNAANSAVDDQVDVTLNGTSRLRLGINETLGSLSGEADSSVRSIFDAITLTVGANDASTSYAGTLTSDLGLSMNFAKTGTGTLTLTGANDYTGTTAVNGGTLRVTGSITSTTISVNDGAVLSVDGAALANTAAVTLNDTGNLTLDGGSETIGSLASSSSTATVTLGANTLTTGDAGDDTFAGVISGSGGLTKAGAGIFTLSGVNDYTGTTTVDAGTLRVTGSVASTVVTVNTGGTLSVDGAALLDTAAVTLNGTGNLTLDGGSETIGSLAGDGTVTLGGNALTLESGTATFAGVISGTGGVTVDGAVQTLSGANDYTGTTTVDAGTLTITGSIDSNVVTVNTGGTLSVDGAALLDTAAVTLNGTGDLTLDGDETIGSLAGDGTVTLGGNALTLESGTATFSGVISGEGDVTVDGAVQTLSGANTYEGETTVASGTLIAGSAGALGDIGNSVSVEGGTLTVNAAITQNGGITQTGGTLNGSGSLTTTGAFAQSGATTTTGGDIEIVAGSFTQSGGATIAEDTTVTSSGAQALEGGIIAGALDGTGAITVSGDTDLTGTVTNAASLTVTGGTLDLTGGGSIDTDDDDITIDGGTIINAGDGFDDSEIVTVTDGTLTMNGADTVASISQGGGVIDGTGVLTGATFTQTGGDMQGSVTTTDDDSDDITLQGGTISGTLTGGGTAITTGTTTLTGTLNSDYIVLSDAGSLTVEGPGAGLSADAQVNVNHGGSTLTLNKDDTVDDVVQNAGTIAGTGTLTTDTYLISAGEMSGILSASGTQSLQNGTISGTLSGAGAVNVEWGVEVTLTGSIASTSVTLQNGGSLTIDPTGTDPEDGLAAATVLTMAGGGAPGAAGTLTMDGDDTITTLNMNGGTIAGAGTLTVTGAATLTGGTISGNLSGDVGGTPTGTVSVETGTVSLTGTIQDVASLTIDGGTLETSGGIGDDIVVDIINNGTLSVLADQEIGGLTGDGDVTIAAMQTLTVSGAGGMFEGDIGGAGSISVVTVTQTLSGTIGGTLTNTGTINVDAGDTLSAGVIENDAGEINVGVGSTLAGTSNTINNGALITLDDDATLTDAGTITNEGTGEIRVTGTGVTIESGDAGADAGITNEGLIAVLADGTVTVLSGSDELLNDGGTITLTAGATTALTLGGTNAQTLQNEGTVTIGAGATLGTSATGGATFVNATGGTATNSGTLGMALTVEDGTFDNEGAVTGATTVTGGTLNLNTGTDLADAQALTVNGGDVNVNASDTVGSLSGTGGTITVADTQTLTVTQSVAGEYEGAIEGDGGLTKAGAATLTLSGTNTFAGPLSVTAGTVTLDNGAAVGDATEVALSANTTLNLLASETVGILTGGDADVTLDDNTLTVTDGTGSFAGDISGTGGLTVEDGADLTLSAANAFTGEALVTGGTLTVTGSLATTTVTVNGDGTLEVDGVALADAAEVTVDGDGTLVLLGSETIGSLDGSGTVNLSTFTLTTGDAGNDTFSGDFTGAGNLIKQGTGTFTLTGASDFTGTTSVNAGVLNIRNNTALGTAAAGTTVATDAALELQGGITVTGEALTLNGSGVSDGGALVNVSGDNTWTGNVTLASASEISSTAGTLTVSGTVDNGGFLLTVDGESDTELSGIISGAGGLTKQGEGVLTLSGVNTYLGATAVNAGELVVEATGEIAAVSAITVGTDGTLTNEGTIGDVTNDGIFDNESLATAGAVVNNATGTNDGTIASLDNNLLATFTTTGEVSDGITNDGTVNAQGDIFGVIQNNGDGVFNITGAAVADDTFTNSGDVNVNGGNLTGITTLTNEDTGTLDIATTRQVSAASVANSDTGVITLVAGAGTSLTASTGGVSNTDDARIDVGADASVTATLGDITNDGEIDIGEGATVDATAGSVVNSDDGEITLLENATLTAGTDVTNADTGVITVGDGATVEATGNVENDASIVIQAGGTVEADVDIDNTANGTITLDDGASLLAGANLLNSNDIDILGTGITIGSGTDVGDLLTNDATGVIDFSADATATFTGVGMLNNGTINLATGSSMTVDGLFQGGTGTINVTGATTLAFDGGYSGAGGNTFNLQNGLTSDSISMSGTTIDFTGTTLQFDIDLTGGGGASDTLTLTGGEYSGTLNVVFTFDPLAPRGQSNDITVVDFGGTATGGLLYTVSGLPDDSGTFVYDAVTVGNDLVVQSSLNPGAGAVIGGAVTIQSLIGSVVNRPTNAFVSGLGFDPGTGADAGTGGTGIFNDPLCRPGAWGRASAGNYSATGTTSGELSEVTATTKGTYRGVQVGSDFGCYRAFDGGWDLVFGATLGVNTGSASQTIPTVLDDSTQSDFKQLYGGLYLTAITGAFTSDLQFRVDRTEFDVRNDTLEIDESFDTNGTTFSGAFSYSVPLEDTGFTLVPTAGFSYSQIASDDIGVPGGRLVTPDYDSRVGFLGGSAVYTMLGEDGLSVTNSFVTVTAYKDFADRPSSLYLETGTDNVLDTLESDNLGAYGEVSLGLNYTRLLDHADSPFGARQLSASIRADHRFGDRIDSWGITAQARLQF